jgi:SAM-dependent methyltransferase
MTPVMSAARMAEGVQARIHRHVVDPWHDRRLGIDASGLHWPDEMALQGRNAAHANEYFGTPSWVFGRALDALGLDTRRFVFVDLGSGKGRTLLLAAERPFLRVEGVELSEAMHRVALSNIARAKEAGVLCAPIVAHHKDAIDYELPMEPFIIYLFNPFTEPVVSLLLDNLEASLRACPREGYFIYLNAKHRNCFDRRLSLREMPRSTWAKAMDRLISPWPIVTYRTRSG